MAKLGHPWEDVKARPEDRPRSVKDTKELSSPRFGGTEMEGLPCAGPLTAEWDLESSSKSIIWKLSGGLGERNSLRIEVGCRGGEQAHRWVESLKPLQDLPNAHRALWTRLRFAMWKSNA